MQSHLGICALWDTTLVSKYLTIDSQTVGGFPTKLRYCLYCVRILLREYSSQVTSLLPAGILLGVKASSDRRHVVLLAVDLPVAEPQVGNCHKVSIKMILFKKRMSISLSGVFRLASSYFVPHTVGIRIPVA